MPKPKLLIVDDEIEIRNTIRFFTKKDYDVIEANDGVEALEILRTTPVDLILSDYNMPRMDGLELLKSLIEMDKSIPIVWLTGQGSDELCRSTWALGIYEYLEKPFEVSELSQCLANALNFKANYSEIRSLRSISKIMFAEPNLILGSQSYREFHDLCLTRGVSVSTELNNLINQYLKKSASNAS